MGYFSQIRIFLHPRPFAFGCRAFVKCARYTMTLIGNPHDLDISFLAIIQFLKQRDTICRSIAAALHLIASAPNRASDVNKTRNPFGAFIADLIFCILFFDLLRRHLHYEGYIVRLLVVVLRFISQIDLSVCSCTQIIRR